MELKNRTIELLDKMKTFVKRGNILSKKNWLLKSDLENAFYDVCSLLKEKNFLGFHQKIKTFIGHQDYEEMLGRIVLTYIKQNLNAYELLSDFKNENFKVENNITDEFLNDFKNLLVKQKVLSWKKEYTELKEIENFVLKSKNKGGEDYYSEYDYKILVDLNDFALLANNYPEEFINCLKEQDCVNAFLEGKTSLNLDKKDIADCSVAQSALVIRFTSDLYMLNRFKSPVFAKIEAAELILNEFSNNKKFNQEILKPIKKINFSSYGGDVNVYDLDYLNCPDEKTTKYNFNQSSYQHNIETLFAWIFDISRTKNFSLLDNLGVQPSNLTYIQNALKDISGYSEAIDEYAQFVNYRFILDKSSIGSNSEKILTASIDNFVNGIKSVDEFERVKDMVVKDLVAKELKKEKDWYDWPKIKKEVFIKEKTQEFLTENYDLMQSTRPIILNKVMIEDILSRGSSIEGDNSSVDFKI